MARGESIETAPKDGRTIIVGADDVGEFLMHWSPVQANSMFPGIEGMWVAASGNMTWIDALGAGPTYWRNLDA